MDDAACAGVVQTWAHEANLNASQIVLVTHATSLPKRWLLGLTAALHSVPLVLTGLGQPWTGYRDKLHATLNATQQLHERAPRPLPTLVVADAMDTLLINPPRALPSRRAVLVAGECSSFPRCFRTLYAMHAPSAHVATCAARRREGRFAACYANGGAYAGRSKELLRLLPMLAERAALAVGVEAGDDQAAMHHLVAPQPSPLAGQLPAGQLSAAPPRLLPPRLRVDIAAQYFVSLYPCLPVPPAAPPGASTSSEPAPSYTQRPATPSAQLHPAPSDPAPSTLHCACLQAKPTN